MMGALQLIAGTVPGWEPVQLQGAQHPAVFGPRACRMQSGKVAAGCCAWDLLGTRWVGAGTRHWNRSWLCGQEGNEQRGNTTAGASRGNTGRKELVKERVRRRERMRCKVLMSNGSQAGLCPDVHQRTAKHQPLSFSHKLARASSPITKPAMIRSATRS